MRYVLEELRAIVDVVERDFSVLKAFGGDVEIELKDEVLVIATIPLNYVNSFVKEARAKEWILTNQYLIEVDGQFYAVMTFQRKDNFRKALEKADLLVIE